jgi:hypothetical protein
MPYAPTVNDNSGQILAQGINQGIGSLAEGIQRSIAERKKKEEERNAKEAVNAAGKGLFGEDFDVKDAKPEQYGQIIQMAQAKRDEPMRQAEQRFKQAQIDNFALQAQLQQSEAARRQSDDAAFRAVYGGQSAGGPSVGMTENQMGMTGTAPVQGGATAADANDVVSRFARGGGSLAAGSQLAAINASNASAAENQAQAAQRTRGEQEFMPRVVDMGDGVKGMTTSRSSAVPINTSNKPLTDVGKLIQDRDNAKTPEDRAKFVQAIEVTRAGFTDKPLTLNEFIMSPGLTTKFADDYNNYRKWDAAQRTALQKVPPPADPATPSSPPAKSATPGKAATASAAAPLSYETAEAVRTAHRRGELTREAAEAILQKQFGYQ